jgi:hypothetical protein
VNLLARLRRTGLARSLAGFCGMLAVVIQLGVPIAHDPAGLGSASPWLGAAICHFGGREGTTTPGVPAGQKSELCPICLGLQATAAALIAPDAGAIALASRPASQLLPLIRDAARSGHDPGQPAQPRAPPVPV